MKEPKNEEHEHLWYVPGCGDAPLRCNCGYLIDANDLLASQRSAILKEVREARIDELRKLLKADPNNDEWMDTNEWHIYVDKRLDTLGGKK